MPFQTIFRREKFFIFEKTLTNPSFKTKAKVRVDVKLVQRDDFPKIAKRLKNFRLRAKINDIDNSCFVPSITTAKERFEIGDVCFVADIQGDIANLRWVALDEAYTGLPERKMQMSSDSAFVYGTYTLPEYRGLGIAPKAIEKVFSYLYERGIRKVYSCICHDNFPSLRIAQKEGFRKIGTITYTRILKLRLYRCKGETEEDYNRLKKMFSI